MAVVSMEKINGGILNFYHFEKKIISPNKSPA
jgi:hypothetical protein